MQQRKIRWDKDAVRQLNEAISYIRKESPQNADKVKKVIIEKINELSENPEVNPPDKYKRNNNGNYRAFEAKHYRISYLIKEDEIVIARIRHTGQLPKEY